jgi:hypothetical protein
MDGGHAVAAAVRTTDGTTYEGVSLPTTIDLLPGRPW